MKKIFLLIAMTFAIVNSGYAQCTPDTSITHNVPGIYPDSTTGLPHSYVGVPYLADIQFRVLTDTTYMGFPAIVDSIKITSVTGLPLTGFSYSCNPTSCVFPGGSDGCIQITGVAPTSGMMGVYPLVVNMTIYGRVFGVPQSISDANDSYTIYIENNVGIVSVANQTFSVGQSIPNPASSLASIPVYLPKASNVHLSVSNLLGKKVADRNVSLQKGGNSLPLDVQGLPSGIYLYTITYNNQSFTRRMIVSE